MWGDVENALQGADGVRRKPVVWLTLLVVSWIAIALNWPLGCFHFFCILRKWERCFGQACRELGGSFCSRNCGTDGAELGGQPMHTNVGDSWVHGPWLHKAEPT